MSWIMAIAWIVFLSPLWGAVAWHAWVMNLKPRLISKDDIKTSTDELIAKYGARAEEIAFIEEDKAWRTSRTFEQGKWRRIRTELRRRHRQHD